MGFQVTSVRRRLAGEACNACGIPLDALPWYEKERYCDRCSASKLPKRVRMAFVYTDRWEVMFFENDAQQTMLPRKAAIRSNEGLVAFSRRAGGPKAPEDCGGFAKMIKRGFGEVVVNLSPEQYEKLKRPWLWPSNEGVRRYAWMCRSLLQYCDAMQKPFDHQALLALWNITEIPACEKGMKYAESFLVCAGDGVDKLGTEDPETRVRLVTEAYMELVYHGIDCDNCNETARANSAESTAPGDELPERDDVPSNPHEYEDKFISDRKAGFQAGMNGAEMDETKTAGWQRGWADAQE